MGDGWLIVWIGGMMELLMIEREDDKYILNFLGQMS